MVTFFLSSEHANLLDYTEKSMQNVCLQQLIACLLFTSVLHELESPVTECEVCGVKEHRVPLFIEQTPSILYRNYF